MSIAWNQELLQQAFAEGAKRLLRCAVYFQQQHMQRLNKSNPRPYKTPSLPGEYPRKRTGFGQGNIVYGPKTIPEVVAAGLKIHLGMMTNANYMLILEFYRDRQGFLKTMHDLQPQLKAFLE